MKNKFFRTAASIAALCGTLTLSGCSIGLPFGHRESMIGKHVASVSTNSEMTTSDVPEETVSAASSEEEKKGSVGTDAAEENTEADGKISEEPVSDNTNPQKEQKSNSETSDAGQTNSDSEKARQQAEQAVQAAKNKANEEYALKNEIVTWLANVSSSYNNNDPAGSVSSLFVSDSKQDEIISVLTKISNVSQSSKSKTGVDLVHYDDTGVVAKIYRYNDGDSNVDGFAAGFARNGDTLLYSPAIFNQYICPTCGGSGSVVTGSTACAICGGTGQQYIPNLFYDPYNGWYGGYQSCSGCGGSGQITTYGACSSCGGWGVHS
jgi:hypothetical protein